MRKARVMVVDDSVVLRKLTTEALSHDSAVEVVGTAANGKIALEKLPQMKPDLIVLDVEMPEMDGLQTLAEIRKSDRDVKVIMFSTLTQKGAETSLEALWLGATDCVGKPVANNPQQAVEVIRAELVPRVKALCAHVIGDMTTSAVVTAPLSTRAPSSGTRVDVLAIGVSTGGPDALVQVFAQLPADFAVPIVIVQHMPAGFTKYLAERLSTKSPLTVREAEDGTAIEPGAAWIAPGGKHMIVRRAATAVKLALTDEAPENSCRPAVDPMFRSVAHVYGRNALGLVLTGMGADGLNGSQAIVDGGGRVIVQDEKTSVVWGMPGIVARAGLAEAVLPLGQIPGRLVEETRIGRSGATGGEEVHARRAA